jgi:UDP-N-acetylmuramate dehydrogenase
MTMTTQQPTITHRAPIPTWYRVGGRADKFAKPESIEQLAQIMETNDAVRVLGEGANLLVADDGIDGVVMSLKNGIFGAITVDPASNLLIAGAGVDLRRLITVTTNEGLGGLEILGGIPATVGGAVRMNAGGTFGQIAQSVAHIWVMGSDGRERTLEAWQVDFGYRHSGLEGSVITRVAFALTPEDPKAVRDRLRVCMDHKKRTQPMGEQSAGCTFKNPLLTSPVKGVGEPGMRVSAGKLIDLADCKGLAVGGAQVSEHHANFFVTDKGATAADVISLMELVQGRVFDKFGLQLEREVVVWERSR